jgi:hypothetical protein
LQAGKKERKPMRRMRWAMYFWPGLIQICIRGSWAGLGVAILAGALFDAALLTTFVWTELLAHSLRTIIWIALGSLWTVSAIVAVVWDGRHAARRITSDPQDNKNIQDNYTEAIEHYLQGDWYEAERILGGLLRRNVRDLDARLMLATLLRHTSRFDEAAGQLEILERFEGAEKWGVEIKRERELLKECLAADITPAV